MAAIACTGDRFSQALPPIPPPKSLAPSAVWKTGAGKAAQTMRTAIRRDGHQKKRYQPDTDPRHVISPFRLARLRAKT